MKTPIIVLALVLCTYAMFDVSMYKSHIHNNNFKPVVKSELPKIA